MPRRGHAVYTPESGFAEERPVFQLGKYSWVVCLPANWVEAHLGRSDPRVILKALEENEGPGFIVRPAKAVQSPKHTQFFFNLSGGANEPA